MASASIFNISHTNRVKKKDFPRTHCRNGANRPKSSSRVCKREKAGSARSQSSQWQQRRRGHPAGSCGQSLGDLVANRPPAAAYGGGADSQPSGRLQHGRLAGAVTAIGQHLLPRSLPPPLGEGSYGN